MEKVQDLKSRDLDIVILNFAVTSYVTVTSYLNSLSLVFISNVQIVVFAICTSQAFKDQMRQTV